MYRLLIVDDEPAILDGLVQLFKNYNRYELDICKACSGEQAISIIKKTKIDIVLTDIKMPGLTGLQMADQILYMWPSCKIIFLTGYNEFDYIYEAFHKSCMNYILKTENEEIIINAVTEAISQLESETERQHSISISRKYADTAIQLLQKGFLKDLLEGRAQMIDRMVKQFSESDVSLYPQMPMILTAGKIDCQPANISCPEKNHLFLSINEILKNYIGQSVLIEFIPFDASTLAWFVQPDVKTGKFVNSDGFANWCEITAFIKGNLESVQNACSSLLNVNISFVIAGRPAAINDIGSEFEMMRRIFSKMDLINQKMMIVDLSSGDSAGYLFDAEIPEPEEIAAGEKEKANFIIDKINRYIYENIGGDLSLARLAEAVYFNPSYLSRFYKQLTGVNIIDYINEVKTEMAKNLLESTQLKANQIAKSIGFISPSYFTAFFKKMTGATPQEFRARIISGDEK